MNPSRVPLPALSLVLVLGAVMLPGCSSSSVVGSEPSRPPADLFIIYSANAPRAAPDTFARYFAPGDYARSESLPSGVDMRRRFRYVLPTSLRVEWKGEPGVRYWTRLGCGGGTPGTVIYDPEHRPRWTPVEEVDHLVASVRRAATLVRATGCHRFGIAPGAEPLFGLDAESCEVHAQRGRYRDLPWTSIDLVDIQGQRLLSARCLKREGLARYEATVSAISRFVSDANPETEVVSQVSFRDNQPPVMKEAIAAVAHVIDGVFFSYPSTNASIPCLYCSDENLEILLEYLRG